jgi:predicted porin
LENIYMKKTLVALAVLAASGASFAQVTMTGEFTWGYKATSVAGADASGFGVDYSNINFAATEDLGGGTKVSVKMGIDGADRSGDGTIIGGAGYTTGQDANITLTGGFGKLMMATMENGNYLGNGIANAGDPAWIDLDGKIQAAKNNGDRIQYSYAFGPVTLGLQHLEAASGLGEGVGSTGNTGQRRNLIEATYAAGALTANVGYAAYDNLTDGSVDSSNNRVRGSANYDFGVAKVGFGVESTKRGKGTVTDTFLGANAPIGALTLAISYGSHKTDLDGAAATAASGADGTKSGYGVGAAYALSKRTQLIANYRSYEATVSAATRSTDTRLYIDHSF